MPLSTPYVHSDDSSDDEDQVMTPLANTATGQATATAAATAAAAAEASASRALVRSDTYTPGVTVVPSAALAAAVALTPGTKTSDASVAGCLAARSNPQRAVAEVLASDANVAALFAPLCVPHVAPTVSTRGNSAKVYCNGIYADIEPVAADKALYGDVTVGTGSCADEAYHDVLPLTNPPTAPRTNFAPLMAEAFDGDAAVQKSIIAHGAKNALPDDMARLAFSVVGEGSPFELCVSSAVLNDARGSKKKKTSLSSSVLAKNAAATSAFSKRIKKNLGNAAITREALPFQWAAQSAIGTVIGKGAVKPFEAQSVMLNDTLLAAPAMLYGCPGAVLAVGGGKSLSVIKHQTYFVPLGDLPEVHGHGGFDAVVAVFRGARKVTVDKLAADFPAAVAELEAAKRAGCASDTAWLTVLKTHFGGNNFTFPHDVLPTWLLDALADPRRWLPLAYATTEDVTTNIVAACAVANRASVEAALDACKLSFDRYTDLDHATRKDPYATLAFALEPAAFKDDADAISGGATLKLRRPALGAVVARALLAATMAATTAQWMRPLRTLMATAVDKVHPMPRAARVPMPYAPLAARANASKAVMTLAAGVHFVEYNERPFLQAIDADTHTLRTAQLAVFTAAHPYWTQRALFFMLPLLKRKLDFIPPNRLTAAVETLNTWAAGVKAWTWQDVADTAHLNLKTYYTVLGKVSALPALVLFCRLARDFPVPPVRKRTIDRDELSDLAERGETSDAWLAFYDSALRPKRSRSKRNDDSKVDPNNARWMHPADQIHSTTPKDKSKAKRAAAKADDAAGDDGEPKAPKKTKESKESDGRAPAKKAKTQRKRKRTDKAAAAASTTPSDDAARSADEAFASMYGSAKEVGDEMDEATIEGLFNAHDSMP